MPRLFTRLADTHDSARRRGVVTRVGKLIPAGAVDTFAMTSPIANAIAKASQPSTRTCNVGRWLDTIDPADRDALADACQPGRINTVWKSLRANGVDVTGSETNWHRHWKGMCACTQVNA